jgi:peptidoglycan/xylan/chitin deacetylase (PgdA/CDA1 family)
MNQHSARNTSLLLLALVLLTGLVLGWSLNDLRRGRGIGDGELTAAVTDTPQPTAESLRPTAVPTAEALRSTALPATAPPALPTAAPTEAPTAASTPEPLAPSPQPRVPTIAGYAGHIVAEGETLEQIAAAGGSAPGVIAAYNLLGGPPQPGRALIVPRLHGREAQLQDTPIMVERGAAGRPWVALTLDAGADAEPTPRMLQALRERGVRITFFLTGRWIVENPDLTRQIVADGHELANHTYRHPNLTEVDDETIRRELADTEAALREVAPEASLRPFFRPPFGAYDERVIRVVQAEGYLPVYWTLDSLDSVGEPKTPEFLLERITGKLTQEQLRGAIILAHCGSAPTADALPAILDRFAAMGFEVRKLSEVL